MSDQLRILLVEDNPGDADLIREMLPETGDSGFNIHCVPRMADAVSYLRIEDTDLALLDLGLPDSNGIDTVRYMREVAPDTPIVVLTGNDDEQTGIAAVRGGAQDYLVKGQTPAYHLSRVLRYAVQRQIAEDKVRESERFLRSTLDALSAHIAIIDASGKIVAVNKAWREFAEANGGGAIDFCNETNYLAVCSAVSDKQTDIATAFAAGIRAVLAGQRDLFEMEYPCHSPSENRWFHGRVTPFPGGEVRRVVVAHEDITARKQAEEEKIQLVAQLRQTQKMEAIGTLAGGIAHDFNNILSAVLGFTELSLNDIEKGTQLENNVLEVYQAGMRAKELVKQILTFARKEDGEVKPTQVSTIAKEALKLIRSTFPATIEIRQDFKSDDIVMADPTQILQLFLNLCTNAAQAMETQCGELSIKIAETKLDGYFNSMHSDFKPGDYLEINITDNGAGISKENLDRIFDPYFSTKASAEGTGLGLAVVHGIVKSCRGEILVESKVGKGTVFTIYLPVSKRSLGTTLNEQKRLLAGTERIMFVDDELAIAEIGNQALSLLGYQVTSLNSSLEALEILKSSPDDFDLVITDMTMPQMTGDRLAEVMMKVKPNIPVILCTGYSKTISKEKADGIGIKAFLMKPVSVREMAATIRKVMDKNHFVREK